MQTVLLLAGWYLNAFLTVLAPQEVHPLHVSVVEVNHNKTERTLEIQCKVYTDDFETTLSKLFKRKTDLVNPATHLSMDTLVERYLSQRVQFSINGKAYKTSYIGFEQEKEAVYAYMEITELPSDIREIQFNISILHDLYDDQINLVHATVKGERKSTKMDYPQTKGSLTF